jgi:single-strand DNA-binding protein
MATDLNRCEFIGRLGSDPELRYTADGVAICNFSIAVNTEFNKRNGEEVKNTEWVRISAFDKLAGICGDWLKKGSQVYVAGKFVTRKWVNKDGVEQYTSEIVLNDLQMLGNKNQDAPSTAPAAPAKAKSDAYRAIKEGNIVPFDDFEDTVPF